MTRLDANYNSEHEHHDIILENLQDDLSTLHVLAITKASLKMVRLAYEDDPTALTEDVFHDACTFCHDLEVLQFLKDHVAPEAYTPCKISSIMMKVLDETQLQTLSTLFPEAVTYQPQHRSSLLQYVRFHDGDGNPFPAKCQNPRARLYWAHILEIFSQQSRNFLIQVNGRRIPV